MTWDQITTAIQDRLKTVRDIGQVHKFLRNTRFWEDLLARAVKDQKFHHWEMTRLGLPNGFDDVGGREAPSVRFRRTHQILIVGRMAVHDSSESELLFQRLVDDVVTILESDVTLAGLTSLPSAPSVDSITTVNFAGVLCHEAKIRWDLSVRSRTSG